MFSFRPTLNTSKKYISICHVCVCVSKGTGGEVDPTNGAAGGGGLTTSGSNNFHAHGGKRYLHHVW